MLYALSKVLTFLLSSLFDFTSARKRINEKMVNPRFVRAAQACADQVGPHLRAKGMLFPSQASILEQEVTTAVRVAEFMFDQGLAQVERPRDLRAWIQGQLYKPHY